MDDSELLDCLSSDYSYLKDAALSAEPTVPVPCCPGWTMADLVNHVAEVYLHKATVMRTGQWPEPWPPPRLTETPPLLLLIRGYEELMTQFGERAPADPALTWYDPDQTVAFWIRRMAQETVIHRIDAEQAARKPVRLVPDDLAVDGVDEVLKRFLAYDSVKWPDEFSQMAGGHLTFEAGWNAINVRAGEAAWTVRPWPREVIVEGGASDYPRVAVGADPQAMLCWLWGRAGDDAVRVTGDPEWARYLRRMMAEVTQ
jgi:Mycothiol maleylpyruvate isomerase N-terminal domain/MDMPI C-terminal domain